MIKLLTKYPVLAICLFVAMMLLPNLDTLQVSIMEARNFVTAREMLTQDHWLLTTLNNIARYQKPPLPAWFSALSGSIFGIKSVFAMRLPAVLMVMLSGSFMYFLSTAVLKSKAEGFINSLIMLTSFYVIGIVFEAPSDIFTHGFMLVCIYFLYKLFSANELKFKHALIAGFSLGLSILAKGPISIYALLLPFLVAYGFTFKYKELRQKAPYILSVLALGVVVGGSWYLYVKLQDPSTLDAIAKKETGTWTSYHTRPFYHYWSFFIQSGIWTIPAVISLIYPYLKKRVSNLKAYQFSLIWTVTAVVLLSLIPMKKARYLMPVLIPLAINIGFYIQYLLREFKNMKDKRETVPVYFNFGLISFIGIALPIVMFFGFREEFQEYLLRFSFASVVLFTLGILIFLRLRAKEIEAVFLLTVVFFASMAVVAVPLTIAFQNPSYKGYADLNQEIKQRQLRSYSLNTLSPEIIWDFGEIMPIMKGDSTSISFPPEQTFGLVAHMMDPYVKAEILSKYDMRKVSTYDMNLFGDGTKTSSGRLQTDFYILEKK